MVGSIRFLDSVSASLGVVWKRLGTVWNLSGAFCERLGSLGTVYIVLGTFSFSFEFSSYYVNSWGSFGIEKNIPRLDVIA